MIQNIDKITTNTGSVILWNNNKIVVSIPKGMYYCHIVDGIVKIKQIAVENIFNIVKTAPIDGETFPLVEDMLKKLSSFSRGGGTGAGGAKAYESLAEAMSETPLPSNGTIFYVPEGSTDSGIYAYDSENLNGYYKVSDLPEKGYEVDLMVNTTHKDLLTLVNNSELVAGQQYRITDYVATVDESVYNEDEVGFFARSNNHAFDIIVTADSINQLNENVRAIRHEGDTYFPSHTKFEAWQIKYTIFNDSERFDWAVSSGKGVIYQLIDEWNNDLPYDFKSIQFQRNNVWVYTFGGTTDASLEVQNCYENKMISTYTKFNNYGYGLNNNTFGDACISNTFGTYCRSNTFGDNCSSNTFGSGCDNNTFGNDCYSYNVSDNVSDKDFTTLISLFTTPPNYNEIKVTSSVNGVVMSQVINATTTESIDI